MVPMKDPKSAKPSQTAQKKPRKKKAHWWSWPWFTAMWSRVALAVGILVVAISGIILIDAYYKLSRMIDRKISGEVFQNTAKVYAAPLLLFPGQSIRPGDITNHLKRVGYAEKGKAKARIGEYSLSKRSLEITPLSDSYYSSSEGAVRIEFSEKSITRIKSLAVGTRPEYLVQTREIEFEFVNLETQIVF